MRDLPRATIVDRQSQSVNAIPALPSYPENRILGAADRVAGKRKNALARHGNVVRAPLRRAAPMIQEGPGDHGETRRADLRRDTGLGNRSAVRRTSGPRRVE